MVSQQTEPTHAGPATHSAPDRQLGLATGRRLPRHARRRLLPPPAGRQPTTGTTHRPGQGDMRTVPRHRPMSATRPASAGTIRACPNRNAPISSASTTCATPPANPTRQAQVVSAPRREPARVTRSRRTPPVHSRASRGSSGQPWPLSKITKAPGFAPLLGQAHPGHLPTLCGYNAALPGLLDPRHQFRFGRPCSQPVPASIAPDGAHQWTAASSGTGRGSSSSAATSPRSAAAAAAVCRVSSKPNAVRCARSGRVTS